MFLTAALIMFYLLKFATATTEQLDLECNILQTQDDLQGRLTSAESHISRLMAENEAMRESLTNAETKISTLMDSVTGPTSRSTYSTYVRWGRTSCPGNGSDLVYAGYAGGSHFNDPGAAVDYLCLPTDPEFAHYEDKLQKGGRVCGAEYAMVNLRDQGMAFFQGIDQSVNLQFQDVPCAVCRTTRSTVLMVPAKTTCHDGWTLEYKGYLSSGNYNHTAASQFVCLDDQPEYIPGGSAHQEISKRFIFAEGLCGSLKCPPYVHGRELTCAMCSV